MYQNSVKSVVSDKCMGSYALVSVIIPAHNCACFIQDAIESVQAQTCPNWEVIIVDDCSGDNTCQVVERLANSDDRIRLIRFSQNKGPGNSRNAAIAVAKGRYIAFLDSDDLWLPDKIGEQLNFMQKKKCALSYTAYKKIDGNGNLISKTIEVPERTTYDELLSTNVIGCLTAMYDSSVLGKLYMPIHIKAQEDYCLWLKILKMGYEARGLNKPLALYRVRSNSFSSSKARVAFYQWKVYREIEGLSLYKSMVYFLKYAYYGYKKSKMY